MSKWLTRLAANPVVLALAGAVAVCVYLGVLVDPSVFYEHGDYFPAFHYGLEFLRPFLSRPGGASQYVAAYLAQACANRWLGAGAFTVLALGLGWGYGLYLRYAAGKRALGWGFLPVLASVLVWTRYGFGLDCITALALAGLGAAAYAHPWIGSLASWRRAGVAIGLLGVGYWLCAGPAYVCVLSISAVEYQQRRQARLAALLLLCGLLLPVALGCLYLGLPLPEAATRLLPYSDASRLEGDFALFLLYGLALVPAFMLFLKRDHAATEGRVARRSRLAQRFGWGRLSPGWRALVGSGAVVALVAAAWSPGSARRMAVMQHCRSREWERVLVEAAKLPSDRFTLDVSYAVDLALYHTGKMGDSLFAFAQSPLSLNLGMAFASCSNAYYYSERPKSVFYIGPANLEMGLVNEAEHVAHEALEVYGPHPCILKQLVLVNLVKRRPEVAKIFLHALCRDPVARSWAKAGLATLARSPDELMDGEEVARIRANLPSRQDSNVAMRPLEERCLAQLEENPRNRMAFEYLMAQYLIARNLEGFIRALPRTEAFGSPALPRHYQEAVLLHEVRTGREVPRWSSQVRSEVRAEFKQFAAVVAPSGEQTDPSRALAAAGAFINTYFHYYVFRPAG